MTNKLYKFILFLLAINVSCLAMNKQEKHKKIIEDLKQEIENEEASLKVKAQATIIKLLNEN